jgi:hypothetical protein
MGDGHDHRVHLPLADQDVVREGNGEGGEDGQDLPGGVGVGDTWPR